MVFRVLISATKILEVIVVLIKYILSQSNMSTGVWNMKRTMEGALETFKSEIVNLVVVIEGRTIRKADYIIFLFCILIIS